MDTHTYPAYEAPVVEDYGTLEALTAASGFVDVEDGGSKLAIHHTSPSAP
jgi:hypothetical protein